MDLDVVARDALLTFLRSESLDAGVTVPAVEYGTYKANMAHIRQSRPDYGLGLRLLTFLRSESLDAGVTVHSRVG